MLSIQEGADKIVRMCMGVKAGERVVIITDLLRPISLSNALQKACMEQGAETILIVIDSNLVDGQLPESVDRAIRFSDVLLCVTTNTLAYTRPYMPAKETAAGYCQ